MLKLNVKWIHDVFCVISGLIKYSDKISTHWPEFSQNGKSDITIADLMRHESGLASLDQSLKPSGKFAQYLCWSRCLFQIS